MTAVSLPLQAYASRACLGLGSKPEPRHVTSRLQQKNQLIEHLINQCSTKQGFLNFYRATVRRYASAVYVVVVCPSVCPCVCHKPV